MIYSAAFYAGLKPDPLLKVSEWANEYRVLSQTASSEPGRWRTDRTPYLKEIMDSLSPSSSVERVIFMKGAQIGGTEAGNNWIGYVIDQTPGPMLVVQPTVEMGRKNCLHLANQTLKDPYIFDFLSIGKDAHEREIEKGLVGHIEKFLMELGAGFSFVGRQYHLTVRKKDYYLDLLFYHLKLRCFVVIEIKAVEFEPEHSGKINFYLSIVDDFLKHPTDNPSIGLILCKSKDNVLAEYALRDMTKPIGLAEYRITENLPENIKTALPTIEELEAELSKISNGKS